MTCKSITQKSLYPPGVPGASGPPLGVHLFGVRRESYSAPTAWRKQLEEDMGVRKTAQHSAFSLLSPT